MYIRTICGPFAILSPWISGRFIHFDAVAWYVARVGPCANPTKPLNPTKSRNPNPPKGSRKYHTRVDSPDFQIYNIAPQMRHVGKIHAARSN